MYFADTFQGIFVPQSDRLFLVFVGIHIVFGLTAVVSGALTALARKERGPHPKRGKVYYYALCGVFVTAIILATIRWPHDVLFASLGTAAFGLATFGRIARHKQWRYWPYVHGPRMGLSYILLLTVFYLDNGPHLPFWKNLPHWAYWVLPLVVGIPLILLALLRFRKRTSRS